MPLSPDSRVVISDQHVFTTLGSEAVILGMRDGVYSGLDTDDLLARDPVRVMPGSDADLP